MDACLQETGKREDIFSLQTQFVGTGEITRLAKAIVAPVQDHC